MFLSAGRWALCGSLQNFCLRIANIPHSVPCCSSWSPPLILIMRTPFVHCPYESYMNTLGRNAKRAPPSTVPVLCSSPSTVATGEVDCILFWHTDRWGDYPQPWVNLCSQLISFVRVTVMYNYMQWLPALSLPTCNNNNNNAMLQGGVGDTRRAPLLYCGIYIIYIILAPAGGGRYKY